MSTLLVASAGRSDLHLYEAFKIISVHCSVAKVKASVTSVEKVHILHDLVQSSDLN